MSRKSKAKDRRAAAAAAPTRALIGPPVALAKPPAAVTLARSEPLRVDFARLVTDIPKSCKFDQPLSATDSRWQDLTAGRGDHSVQLLQHHFEHKTPGDPLHLVFASHRGAGKTTELERLARALSSRYYPLYLDANVEMDPNRIDAEDLLLVLAQRVELYMRENGLPLSPELLGRVGKWFDEVVRTTSWGKDLSLDMAGGFKVEAGLPFFAKLTASVSSLFKVESKHREEVKNVLKKFPGTLLDSVNALLDAANELLRPSGKELLVIVDNLDRYEPQVIDGLLVRNGDRIRSLHCNLILTPPISMIYRPQTEPLDAHFPCEIMNTVRLRRKEQPYAAFDGPGHDLLLDALSHRLDLDTLIPEPPARDRLVTASGGAIRELLALVGDASLLASVAARRVITLADVEEAVSRKKQLQRDRINSNGWWPTLVRIARDKQIFADEACMKVLFHRLAFKYNGDGWYDVHPLVTEQPEFQLEWKNQTAR